jgi:hypothetical protein
MKKLIVVAILAVSCTSKTSEDRLNTEAILLHNSMIKKSVMIRNRLTELKSDSSVSQDSVRRLFELLERWESDLVEVPGNEHHDDAHHSHDHGHATPAVTAEQMLAIQKELDKRLSVIGSRIFNLKPELDHVDHEH